MKHSELCGGELVRNCFQIELSNFYFFPLSFFFLFFFLLKTTNLSSSSNLTKRTIKQESWSKLEGKLWLNFNSIDFSLFLFLFLFFIFNDDCIILTPSNSLNLSHRGQKFTSRNCFLRKHQQPIRSILQSFQSQFRSLRRIDPPRRCVSRTYIQHCVSPSSR